MPANYNKLNIMRKITTFLLLSISVLLLSSCDPSKGCKLSLFPTNGAMIKGDTWIITDAGSPSADSFKRLQEALTTANRNISLVFPNIETFPERAFTHVMCKNDGVRFHVSAPEAITIGTHAFSNFSNVQSVDFPKVTAIGPHTFTSSYALQRVSIPSAPYIPAWAFSVCWALQEVDAPLAQFVGEYAFMDCTSIYSLELPSVLVLHDNALSCTKLTELHLPFVELIGYKAIKCSALRTLDLPNVVTVKEAGISGCKSLEYLSLPKVRNIGRTAFFDSSQLKVLTIATESTLQSVGESLFFNSTRIKQNTHLNIGKNNKFMANQSMTFKNGKTVHNINYWAGQYFKSISAK